MELGNCGHIHSQAGKTEGVDQDLPLHWNQMDVGCDYWNWKPVSLDTIEYDMSIRCGIKDL